jgi:hypothetical protein
MSQDVSTCFSSYNQSEWNTLMSQTLQNYGSAVLEERFDYQSVPEQKRSLVEQFRIEYFYRKREFT